MSLEVLFMINYNKNLKVMKNINDYTKFILKRLFTES